MSRAGPSAIGLGTLHDVLIARVACLDILRPG